MNGENELFEEGERVQDGYCRSTPLCHFSHLSSSLLVISFHCSIRSPSAVGNKASKHIKLMGTLGNVLPRHICDPTS